MANISKIKLPNDVTYDIKDSSALKTVSTTGSGNAITSASVSGTGITFNKDKSFSETNHTHTSQQISLPTELNGTADIAVRPLINSNRANRLAFLPASQIIIEKTTDGGTTWTDANISDEVKTQLFSEIRPGGVKIPLDPSTGKRSINCGLRITITAMTYNVPSETSEVNKYNYWNSDNVIIAERYCYLYGSYFFVNSSADRIGVKIERATGGNSTNWISIYDSDSRQWAGLSGWSGNDWVTFSQSTFGGSTDQTGNCWNYRYTFFTRPVTFGGELSSSSQTSAQSIMEIRGYGDAYWTKSSNYMANDHIYTIDQNKNASFPGNITPDVNNTKTLGTSGLKWNNVYATTFTGDLSGNASSATKLGSSTVGAQYTPIYLNAGSPTQVSAPSIITNLASTSGASPYQASPRPGVTGTLPIANGGTGATSASAALTALGAAANTDATTSVHGLMTAADKVKLNGIATGAEVNVQSDWNVTDTSSDAFIKNKPTIPSAVTESTVSGWGFTKNTGTVTTTGTMTSGNVVISNGNNVIKDSGFTIAKSVPSDAKFTDTIYTAGTNVSISSSNVISATDTTYSDATTSVHGLMSTSDKTKLNGIASGAEVNQNAFSNIAVGSTTIAADSKTDTLTLVAGDNITLTPDATNDKITISAVGGSSGTTIHQYDTLTVTQNMYLGATNPTSVTGLVAGDIYIYVPTSN